LSKFVSKLASLSRSLRNLTATRCTYVASADSKKNHNFSWSKSAFGPHKNFHLDHMDFVSMI
jgi:hypothetical protein